MSLPLAVVLGAGTGVGLSGVVLALWPSTPAEQTGWVARLAGAAGWVRSRARRLMVCAAVGVIVLVFTGWPVAGAASGLLAWAASSIWGPDRRHAAELARIKAVAAWTASLRDVLAAAAGLEQALIATAKHAEAAIAGPLSRLADAIGDGRPLVPALRRCAGEVDDETCDLVVAALIMAAEREAGNLTDRLSSLADVARDRAGMRMRTAAARARVRTATRVITGTAVAMATGLVLFNPAFVDPYSGPAGQAVLAAVCAVFAAALWWLHRLAAMPTPPRMLAITEPATGVPS